MIDPSQPDPETASFIPQPKPGGHVGPYKLLQQIGEGGMGVVFMAEQEQPVRRRVALKIIKPGMDSVHVIARFKAEQQALALMDHQNIAKVFDAGVTDERRPYFVMELVHGVPITKYCDDNKLTPKERLELFVPVCRAVQHAHQKGIIHRDLKPSNVLVCLYDGKPVAKVIDFGVAKAMEQPLTDATMFTQFGQVIGTLEYMSPEQAEMSQLGIDTRSDIYSLGVMLYELLTGSTPLQRHRVKKAALDEILKLIREEEPPPPSSRLSKSTETLPAISQQRRMEPAQLTRVVRGELDWIVMKSLEKDRTRRYDSASAFAQDIERYLTNEPVEACPPSATYRLRKYAFKHRVLLSTVASFALILLAGTGISIWQAVRATNAEGVAEKARTDAEKDRDDAKKATAELASASEKLRRVLYTSDMNLVSVAWNDSQPKRALDLLERHRPRADETDLRGFEWHYWRRRLNSETSRTELEGYADWKRSPNYGEMISINLKMSPQGRFAADAIPAKAGVTLKVWDIANGKAILTTYVPSPRPGWKSINPDEVLFSPDESQVIVFSLLMPDNGMEGMCGFWQFLDRTSGKHLYTLENDLAIYWLPDRKRLLTWHDSTPGKERKMLLRDAATGKELGTFAENVVFCVFDRGRTRCALLIQEKQGKLSLIRIHDTATGKKISEIPLPASFQPGAGSSELCFVDDRATLAIRLAAGDTNKKRKEMDWPAPFNAVTGWDIATGAFRWSYELEQNAQQGLLAVPNQPLLMVQSGRVGEVALLRGNSGEVVSRFMIQTEQALGLSHLNVGHSVASNAPFSHDGARLVAFDAARSALTVYSLLGFPQTVFSCKFVSSFVVACFSADGQELIALDIHEGIVRRWNTQAWPRFDPKASNQLLNHVVVTPSGRVGFSHENTPEGTVTRAIDLRNGAVLMSFGKGPVPMPGEFSRANGLVVAATDDYVAFSSNDSPEPKFGDNFRVLKRGIRLIHLPTQRETVLWKEEKQEKLGSFSFGWQTMEPSVTLLPGHGRAILRHDDTPGIPTPGRLGRSEMVDFRDGARRPSWLDEYLTGNACVGMPDQQTVVLSCAPKNAKATTLPELMCADVNSGRVHWKVALSAPAFDVIADRDGRRILVNLENSLVLLDAKTGKRIVSLDAPTSGNYYRHLQFSPDGTRILGAAFAHMKQTLYLWDVTTGASLGVLSGHGDVANRFSKSGQQLVGLLPSNAIENRLVVIDASPLPGDEPITAKRNP